MTKRKPCYASGAVLMLDLDLYLDQVRALSPEGEWNIVYPVYAAVESLATARDFHLVRIFGDGFLLYALGEPDRCLLDKAIGLLVDLRTELARHGFNFKAALAAGTLVLAERHSEAGELETVIAGAVANTAGKAIRKAVRATLTLNWPQTDVANPAETFDSISAGTARRVTTVAISSLAAGVDPFSLSPMLDATMATPTEIASFSGAVKGVLFEVIKMADDKAKAIFAVAGGFLVFLFNGKVDWAEFIAFVDLADLLRFAFWLCAMLLFIGSSFFALHVLYPRVGTSHKGLLFYGSIAQWADAATYTDRLKNASSGDLARESAVHNFDLSKVTVAKYSALRRSIWTMSLGIIAALLFLGTQWLAFP